MILKFLKIKWFVLILAFLVIPLALMSCANFNKRSYQSLGVMAVTYDTAMKSAADLYAKGLITTESKQKIVTVATSYQTAHNSAIDSFQSYLSAPPEQQADKKQQFIVASQVALKAYGELLKLLGDFGVYGEPVEPWF